MRDLAFYLGGFVCGLLLQKRSFYTLLAFALSKRELTFDKKADGSYVLGLKKEPPK